MSKANRGSQARIERKSARLKQEYAERDVRIAAMAAEAAREEMPVEEAAPEQALAQEEQPSVLAATDQDVGKRLDQFLSAHLAGVSRSRLQMLIEQRKLEITLSDGAPLADDKFKPSYKLRGGETIHITGRAAPPPLRAKAEDLPLDIVYEDDDLAVLNKAAGMVVHAGAGAEDDDERGGGTVVNAILHHFQQVSKPDDPVRPGIVHRLDKQTSGLLVIAKNDAAHQKLSEAFAERRTRKHYIALVHGDMEPDKGTINLPVSRDLNRRTRMTTRSRSGRTAITHWTVRERLHTAWGDFTLLDVRIETGRTHQIRVHLSSAGHPIVGDNLYGAPYDIRARELANQPVKKQRRASAKHVKPLQLERNFLHAASLALPHPRTGKEIEWQAPLPPELAIFLATLKEERA